MSTEFMASAKTLRRRALSVAPNRGYFTSQRTSGHIQKQLWLHTTVAGWGGAGVVTEV